MARRSGQYAPLHNANGNGGSHDSGGDEDDDRDVLGSGGDRDHPAAAWPPAATGSAKSLTSPTNRYSEESVDADGEVALAEGSDDATETTTTPSAKPGKTTGQVG